MVFIDCSLRFQRCVGLIADILEFRISPLECSDLSEHFLFLSVPESESGDKSPHSKVISLNGLR